MTNTCRNCHWWDGEREPVTALVGGEPREKASNPDFHKGHCMVRPPVVVVCHESNDDHPESLQYEVRTLYPLTIGKNRCAEWTAPIRPHPSLPDPAP